MFEKGDLKYVFLDLLNERPRHGYDLIRAIEERFGGRYSTSPGTVYPILQMLEDMGHVRSEQRDGRKTYTVTEAGQAFLAERRAQVQEIWDRAEACCPGGPEGDWPQLVAEFKQLGELLWGQARRSRLAPDQLARIREVVAQARHTIERILAEPG